MSRFKWACPTCGAATHSKEALVRSSEKSCSCDSALWVASDMPPCVGKLQEEIAALREKNSNLLSQTGHLTMRAVDLLSETRRLLERIAALEKVAEAAALLFDNYELNDPWDVLEEALREAGYLGGEGD